MSKIKEFYNMSNTDFEEFNKGLKKCINLLQSNGLEVEVQYKTNLHENGQIVYSVLLIGREM